MTQQITNTSFNENLEQGATVNQILGDSRLLQYFYKLKMLTLDLKSKHSNSGQSQPKLQNTYYVII